MECLGDETESGEKNKHNSVSPQVKEIQLESYSIDATH